MKRKREIHFHFLINKKITLRQMIDILKLKSFLSFKIFINFMKKKGQREGERERERGIEKKGVKEGK